MTNCCARPSNPSSELWAKRSQLLRFFPEYRDRITLVSDIVAFRNQIIHGCATIKDDMVWEIVQVYLPRLHREVAELLEKRETGGQAS